MLNSNKEININYRKKLKKNHHTKDIRKKKKE
jgi:hypothetical protein